ncbi:hypothetical protein FL857_02005 [Criibacterium bergeronii]|uniref:Uncharacterized protein n=1 Tax=Criibacterium bergeronii TaxID=1871336 RepID=A0A552VCR4_9FIRM|nr:hypothetical protein [Criibacterium bergeronii]TRW28263.1 hypothetical protein FL857_02005 [Criibacterium bergeronii]
MLDLIVIAIIALIIGGAGFYIYKAKKSGQNVLVVQAQKLAAQVIVIVKIQITTEYFSYP